MAMNSPRWTAVTESQFPWEREALDWLRARLPDYNPWQAWANFEFIDDAGKVNEIDALVLSPAGLFLIEIKSRPGLVTGDTHTWIWTTDGRDVFSGRPPAASTPELHDRLRAGPGLRLSDVLDGAGRSLQDLIQFSTLPQVSVCFPTVDGFLKALDEVEDELTAPSDPVHNDRLVAEPEAFAAVAQLATPSTTIAELGYSVEAQKVLEDMGIHNLRELLAVDRIRFRYLKGVYHAGDL